MTLFSNRVLKSGNVFIDTENKVIIEVAQSPEVNVNTPAISEAERENNDTSQFEAKARTIMQQARYQADQIVSDARMSAATEQANIIRQAESEAERIKSEARDNAYQEGMAQASREGEAIKAEANQVLENAKAERFAMQESLEPEILQLIIDIMEKLLVNSVQFHPQIIINLIKQGLSTSTITGDITVYVSASDFDNAVAEKDEILSMTDGSVKLDIVKDLSLNPMDCVIETPFGSIDASLGQQYEALRENLTYILQTNLAK